MARIFTIPSGTQLKVPTADEELSGSSQWLRSSKYEEEIHVGRNNTMEREIPNSANLCIFHTTPPHMKI